MSAHPTSLANDIRSAGAPIDPAKVSITKWKPVEAVVAEALNLDPEEVYGTTISKAGNLSVRVGQSKRGRNAPVVLLMYTGPNGELERCIDAAKEHCSDRDLALVFVEDTRGWTLVGIMKPQSAAVPPASTTSRGGEGGRRRADRGRHLRSPRSGGRRRPGCSA